VADVSDIEVRSFYRGIAICQRMIGRALALDLDKRVLCFDGELRSELDVSIADRLEDGGLFVVRSGGGNPLTAVKLAEAVRERHATVVVYDYCLSACASYLLVASTKAFVRKNTLVAWHHPVSPYLCPLVEEVRSSGAKRLAKDLCSDAPANFRSGYEFNKELDAWFYSTRAVSPPFDNLPQSIVVRRILLNRFSERGEYPSYWFWTWNPRYYPTKIKTKITYEAYPQSQDEVDVLARWLQIRVIYDP